MGFDTRGKEWGKDNFKDVLDLMFYEQLEDEVLGYTQVSIIDFLDHLKTWCRINATIRKKMKDKYLIGWKEEEHITAFKAQLMRGKKELSINSIVVNDDEIRDHYVIEMYKRKIFDKNEMTEYEKLADPDKDWDPTHAYFEGIVEDHEEYENNTGGASKKVQFESAASVRKADEELEDNLQRYIKVLEGGK